MLFPRKKCRILICTHICVYTPSDGDYKYTELRYKRIVININLTKEEDIVAKKAQSKYSADNLVDASMAKMILEVGNSFKCTKSFQDNRFGGFTEVPKNTRELASDVKDRLKILGAIKQHMNNPNAAPEQSVDDILNS